MKTFGQMKNSIADWLGIRETDTNRLPASVRGDLVNMKIKDICRKADIRFAESESSISVSVGSTYVSLPDDFSRPYFVRLTVSSSTYFLEQLSFAELRARFPNPENASAGTPSLFAVYGNKMYFDVKASGSGTIDLRYYAIPDDLVSDSDTNDFLEFAWDVILFGCLADASIYGIEDSRIPAFNAKFNELLNGLIVEHYRARSVAKPAIANVPGEQGG